MRPTAGRAAPPARCAPTRRRRAPAGPAPRPATSASPTATNGCEVDTRTSGAHCGRCGNACPSGQTCNAGTCSLVCTSGLTGCGIACVNTQTDGAHCGACGTTCAAGQSCAAGVCLAPCAAGTTRCGSSCVDTRTDSAHCGSCGARVAAGEACVAGAVVRDCRVTGAVACASGAACDYLTGACLPAGTACTIPGVSTACGTQRCGVGARCNTTTSRCEAAAGCAGLACDASGLCRGVTCSIGGGGVRGLTLDAPTVGAAGARGGLALRARVDAEALCGLDVGFDVRTDGGYYVSSGNDGAIWQVTNTGAASQYLRNVPGIGGVAYDRAGTLYYAVSRMGQIYRVQVTGGVPTGVLFGSVAPVGRGVSRLIFGTDGRLYATNGPSVVRFDDMGRPTTVFTVSPSTTSLMGITFDADGSLLALAHRPWLYRLAPGATAAAQYINVQSVLGLTDFNWFGEAVVLGPDGRIYGSSFPDGTTAGLIFRTTTGASPSVERFVTRTEIQRDVPGASYIGIHGMTFGADGSLYFVNQNTNGNTREARGQLLARRPDGTIALVASGFNLNWTDGSDGDVVAALSTAASAAAPVRAGGVTDAVLDVPATPGTYEVRAFITDPRNGAVRTARTSITVR